MKSQQNNSAVVFDLDDTLLDRRGSLDIYVRRLYCDFHGDAEHSLDGYCKIFRVLDADGLTPRTDFLTSIGRILCPQRSLTDLRKHYQEHAWQSPRLFPGTESLLSMLRNGGVKLGLITNGWDAGAQKSKIEKSGIFELLDAVVISDEFGASKPDPRVFHHAAKMLGVYPPDAWYVGDNPITDIVGASRSGFRAAWIERHISWPEDLERCYMAKLTDLKDVQLLLCAA